MIDLPERDPLRNAQALLGQSPFIGLRDVTVDRYGDALILSGHVDSYYAKQLAQETVRPAISGMRLINRVEVAMGVLPQ